MCLIAVSANGFKDLNRSFWRACCAAFPDGLGIMHFTQGKVHAQQRTCYDVDTLDELLSKVPVGVQVAVHLRAATYGGRQDENVHPHLLHLICPDQAWMTLAVMHNGSIPELNAQSEQGPSDTAIFTHVWLKERIEGNPLQWNAPLLLEDVRQLANNNSRIVLLDSRGTWAFIGESQGVNYSGSWLSNKKVIA